MTLKRYSTVLITGGSGFIGSYVAMHYHNLGHRVVVVDIIPPSTPLSPMVNYVQADVRNTSVMEEIIGKHSPSAVIHCAAWKNARQPVSWMYATELNATATANLHKVCMDAGVEHFVFLSSCAVYEKSSTPIGIDSPLISTEHGSQYGVSKILAEQGIEGNHRGSPDTTMKTSVLRLFNVVCNHPVEGFPASGGIHDIVSSAMRTGKHIDIHTTVETPSNTYERDFVDIAVVIKHIDSHMAYPKGNLVVSNVGSGVKTSIADVVEHCGGFHKLNYTLVPGEELNTSVVSSPGDASRVGVRQK